MDDSDRAWGEVMTLEITFEEEGWRWRLMSKNGHRMPFRSEDSAPTATKAYAKAVIAARDLYRKQAAHAV